MTEELKQRNLLVEKLARLFPTPQEASFIVQDAGGRASSLVHYGESPYRMWQIIVVAVEDGAVRRSAFRDAVQRREVRPTSEQFDALGWT